MANTPLHIPSLIDRNKWKDYRKEIWGDSFNWSWNRTTKQIEYLVIHHSVTAHDASPDYIAQLHKNKGWGGIGYHFLITKDGVVWYVGDVGTARANVAGMNEQVIGICVIGDFTQYNPSNDQIKSAHDLCEFFLDQANWPNLKNWEDVVGHKELKATACPGTSWKGVSDSMYERIKNRIPYTPDTPPVDYKVKFEKCSKGRGELKTKHDELEKRFKTAEATLTIIKEWKEKIAIALGIGVDWPKILDQINEDTKRLDELQSYEKYAILITSKLNELLSRDFKMPDDKDNLLSSLDEYKGLESDRKTEVDALQSKAVKLEKAKRPIDKLKWHEHFILAIKKLIPFIKKGGDTVGKS